MTNCFVAWLIAENSLFSNLEYYRKTNKIRTWAWICAKISMKPRRHMFFQICYFLFFFFFLKNYCKRANSEKRGMYLQCHLLAEIPPFNYVLETINLHKNTLKIANHTQICWKWCYFWAYLLQTYLKIKVFHHFPYHICANFIRAFLLKLIFGLFLGFESSDNLVMD